MSLPLTLTYGEAAADLAEFAAANPGRSLDDMGGRCVYFRPDDADDNGPYGDLEPGQGCCIVGKVLERHGVTYVDLAAEKANGGENVHDLVGRGLLVVDPATERLLQLAQSNQDGGATWERSVSAALQGIEFNY